MIEPDYYLGENGNDLITDIHNYSPIQALDFCYWNFMKYYRRLGKKDNRAREIEKMRTYFMRYYTYMEKGTPLYFSHQNQNRLAEMQEILFKLSHT